MISREHLVKSLPVIGFFRGVNGAFGLLTRKEKIHAVFLVLSMNVNALLGLVGLAGILPFVHLMLEPDPLAGQGVLARTLRACSFTSTEQALYAVGSVLIGLILVKNVFAYIHSYFQNLFSSRAEIRLATDLLARVVNAPYIWIIARNTSIIRDVVVGQSIEWSRGLIRSGLQLINDLLFLLAALVFLVITSPLAGLLICGFSLVLAMGLTKLAHPRINFYGERKRRAIRVAGVIATEAIAGGRDVRLSAAGEPFIRAFGQRMQEYSLSDAAARQWQLLPRAGIEVIGFSVLVGGALLALWNDMPRAEIAALLTVYAVIAVRAIPVISQAVASISAITSSLPAMSEVQNLIRELPALQSVPHTSGNSGRFANWRRLHLSDVTFKFPGAGRAVLGAIDISFERGRSYGIVGKSGAGKSTLVDVITGLLPPSEGEILIDGRQLDRAHAAGWIEDIACVSQSPFMLDGTLQENIEFGKVHDFNGNQRLESAIEAAGLAEFVRTLPEGLATPLGERGVRLSGGQRQRVAIARGLYRGAQLLVLDEATSALDSLTERDVTEAIEALKGRITLLVVAHRISTVSRLDEIILIENGQVAGHGPHRDLLAASALYRNLVEAQAVESAETVH